MTAVGEGRSANHGSARGLTALHQRGIRAVALHHPVRRSLSIAAARPAWAGGPSRCGSRCGIGPDSLLLVVQSRARARTTVGRRARACRVVVVSVVWMNAMGDDAERVGASRGGVGLCAGGGGSDRRLGGPAWYSMARGGWRRGCRGRRACSRGDRSAPRGVGAAARGRGVARRLRIAIKRVAEVDPTLVGVDRAEQTILPGAGVPAYQLRTVDRDLVAALGAALDGSGPWMVVVEGRSKVGKSRSLFEALLACDRAEPVELVAPVDAVALRSLMTPGEGLRPGLGAAALWLDDLEPFLNSGVTWRMNRPGFDGGSGVLSASQDLVVLVGSVELGFVL